MKKKYGWACIEKSWNSLNFNSNDQRIEDINCITTNITVLSISLIHTDHIPCKLLPSSSDTSSEEKDTKPDAHIKLRIHQSKTSRPYKKNPITRAIANALPASWSPIALRSAALPVNGIVVLVPLMLVLPFAKA